MMMPSKSDFITGAAAVAAADLASNYLPASLDMNNLPVRRYGSAVAGAYLGEKFGGGEASLGRAFIAGIVALASANLKSRYLPSISFPVAQTIDVARLVAGGVGIWGASKLGLPKTV